MVQYMSRTACKLNDTCRAPSSGQQRTFSVQVEGQTQVMNIYYKLYVDMWLN